MSPNADTPSETAVETDISALTNQSATFTSGMLLHSSMTYVCVHLCISPTSALTGVKPGAPILG